MLRALGARLVPQRASVVLNRNYTSGKSSQSSASQPKSQSIPDVKGVSSKVVNVPDYPVGFAGSKKDTDYKNPEYFCYHVDSFADSMVEMASYRLPPPSSKKK